MNKRSGVFSYFHRYTDRRDIVNIANEMGVMSVQEIKKVLL